MRRDFGTMNLKKQEAAESALHDQTNFLPHKKLILTFFVLAVTLLVYFFDQIGVGQIVPTVGKEVESKLSWIRAAHANADIASCHKHNLMGRHVQSYREHHVSSAIWEAL